MIDHLLANLAPHYCYGCQKPGSLLCHNCKNDIIEQPFLGCIGCLRPLVRSQLCDQCHWPFEAVWCVAERDGPLRQLIDGVKFERKQAGISDLVDLLDASLPVLSDNMRIVPIPASSRSVRERGYDQMLLVARQLGKRRGLQVNDALIRQTTARMHELPLKQDRTAFAKRLFRSASGEISGSILLLDDIITTGETVKAAAEVLRKAGATQVSLGVIARHISESTTV